MGAIAALEKGMGFLQMGTSQKNAVERMVASTSQLDEYQRESVMDLLQGKQTMQSSGEITGMLKAMLEEMEGDLATAKKDEATASSGFEVVQTQDDMEDTQKEVAETQAFIGDLAKQCAEKKSAWAEIQKTRAEEISAISEAIKVLNDDDALALFKKAVPAMVQTG